MSPSTGVKEQRAGRALPLLQGPVAASIIVGLLCLVAIFFREIRAAVDVWNASTAYSHCYLVLPMTLYLLWERRRLFGSAAAKPEALWLFAAVPISLVWLVSERLGVMEGRQLAAIAGVELLLLTMLGRSLFSRISGPLLFLFFLVPFGAFLTPALQRFTAGFTIVGLDLLGIPNYSDKFIIETPAGTFFVAEACAGLRFLIAAIAFGVFYALLSYVSPGRRLGFIAASIIVPIVANGFRALGIVVLGQVLGSAEAAAADHIIYGWVFFSAVMLLLIAVGQLFREDLATVDTALPSFPPVRDRAPGWNAFAVIILLSVGPALAATIDMQLTLPDLGQGTTLNMPPDCVAGASAMTELATRETVVTCGGTRFVVSLSTFPARSTANVLVLKRRTVTQEVSAEDATIVTVSVPVGAGNWAVVQTTDPNRVTAYASWVDGHPGQGGLSGRLDQARDSLFGSNYEPALITITAAEPTGASPNMRKATLDLLVRLIQGQPGLNERVAKLTRIGSLEKP